MDPSANLEEIGRLAEFIVEGDSEALNSSNARRLAELVLELDSWIRRGGFLPAPWAQGIMKKPKAEGIMKKLKAEGAG